MQCRLLTFIFCCLLPMLATAGTPHIPGGPRVTDCNKARDPILCEARVAARKACQHKQGSLKRQCMDARKVLPECRDAENPLRCSQRKRAENLCRKQSGKAFRNCVRQEEGKFAART